MRYADLLVTLIPEVVLTATVLAVLGLDLGWMRRRPIRARMWLGTVVTTLGCLAAACWVLGFQQATEIYNGMVVVNDLNRLVKLALLFLTVATAWISVGANFTEHVGEYFALLLLATIGMTFLVSTDHLLMIFISLELLSLSLYILTAFHKRQVQSAEAALKYFLFGGMAAAFLLFGLSLVYGLSGELRLEAIATVLGNGNPDPLLIAALVMVLIGFGFKVAAAPFHLWAPDTYQGAPIPSAALVASGSKVAGFFILGKVMMTGFKGAEGSVAFGGFAAGWVSIMAVLAILSVVLGNLAALAQSSVRRLLAYSAIAQAGYVLVGLMGGGAPAMASVLYYAITYAVTVLGTFGVVGWVQEATGREDIAAFAGLGRRAPLISFCMLIFLLSLAGIPPLAGFFGKFYLFTAAIQGDPGNVGMRWMMILAVAMSAVSLYYYLKVLKQIFVAEAPAEAAPWPDSSWHNTVLASLALAVVVLGCLPGLLLNKLLPAITALGF